MRTEHQLDGKTAVVTGGARGIGRAITERLLAAGALVAVIDLDAAELESLRAPTTDASTTGGHSQRLFTLAADMALVPEIREEMAEIFEWCGEVDILVNNVGGSFGTPLRIDDVTEDDYDSVLGRNLKSAFFATQSVLPGMRRRKGGSVINIASISGRMGIPSISAQYSAAKGGILALTRNLATSLGADNIRVNAIAPGYIRSGPRVEAIWNSRDPGPLLGSIALGRRGESSEIAAAAVFLASDAAAYITGATLDVNGGLLCL